MARAGCHLARVGMCSRKLLSSLLGRLPLPGQPQLASPSPSFPSHLGHVRPPDLVEVPREGVPQPPAGRRRGAGFWTGFRGFVSEFRVQSFSQSHYPFSITDKVFLTEQ